MIRVIQTKIKLRISGILGKHKNIKAVRLMFNFNFVWQLGSLALYDERNFICLTSLIFEPNSLCQSAWVA